MSGPVERAREASPSWDEVRERRVLARVQGARAERGARRRRAGQALAVSALAAIALIAVTGWWMSRPTPPTASAPSPVEGVGRLALSDGSEIELTEGAHVEVEIDTRDEVRLVQHDGAARYVVSHRPERRFVVRCDGVQVEVRGTRFWVRHHAVEAEAAIVEVEVEEGRVEVRRGGERSLLTVGESLRVRSTLEVEAPTETEGPSEVIEADPPAPAPSTPMEAREPAPRPSASRPPSSERRERAADVSALLTEAEEARRAGRLDDAVAALNEVLSLLGDDPRAATAYFTLGRVERTRSRHAAAAAAFEAAYARDPDAILAEDALAEATISWSVAGRLERARGAGQRYLARYPDGQYLERVRAALGD